MKPEVWRQIRTNWRICLAGSVYTRIAGRRLSASAREVFLLNLNFCLSISNRFDDLKIASAFERSKVFESVRHSALHSTANPFPLQRAKLDGLTV